jgi:hypothetical protein
MRSDYHEQMRGEAYEASHFKVDRHKSPPREPHTGPLSEVPPNRAQDPKRRVGKWSTRTCSWCGGSGIDTAFGGSTDTCQTCGGQGVEEVQT